MGKHGREAEDLPLTENSSPKRQKVAERHNELIRGELKTTTPPERHNELTGGHSNDQGPVAPSPSSSSDMPGSVAFSGKDGSVVKRLQFDSPEPEGDLAIQACLNMVDGEYTLKLKHVPTSTPAERAEQLAESGAILLFQGEMLQKLGRQLLFNFEASFKSMIQKPAPASRSITQ